MVLTNPAFESPRWCGRGLTGLRAGDNYDVKYIRRSTHSSRRHGAGARSFEGHALPHVVIEYSSNLEGRLDFPGLLIALRDTALATGVFPIGGIRVRAYRADHYLIADGHPDNAFVHIVLRVGHGRDLDTRKRACDAIFATACDKLAALYERSPLGISLEMQEVDAVLTCKKNNLHEYVKRRGARSE
jgi:5-carboxymethyl-2-hydroxymuconate isomerase